MGRLQKCPMLMNLQLAVVFAAATDAVVTKIKMPGKHFALHKLHDADGVCFTSCFLHSFFGEDTYEKAFFFHRVVFWG